METPFEQPAANEPQGEIVFGAGFTQPTVKFGNVKYYLSMKIPCALSEFDEVTDFAEQWVEDRLSKKMTEIVAEYGTDGGPN